MCKLWCQLACKITGRGLRICEMLTSYRSLEAGRGRRPIARSSWSMIAISSSVARWIVVPHGQLISLFSLNHVTVFCICAPHLGHTTGSTQFSRTPDILISLCLLHFVRWSPNPTTVGAAAYTLAIFTLWEEYHKWHSQRSIRRVSITTRRPLTNRVQFRLRRHATNEIWDFARSKAQAMHPEIACNNNYDNHYANDIKDVHCVCSRYEMVVRGVTKCSHAQ